MNALKTTKICPKCQVERPVSEFSKDKYKKDGLCAHCKVCHKAYCQTDNKKISNKKYNQSEKGIETIKKNQNKYYQTYKNNLIKKVELDLINKNKLRNLEGVKKYQKTEKGKITKKKAQQKYVKTETGREAVKKGGHKHRALKAGATIEDFSPVEIFERDGYRCQLCGKKTRPDFKNYNHPLYPNLDHIIPLSKGGEHSKLNTQCLCHQCNIEKHNSEDFGDQLLLFG